jgi:hypothetical protein
MAAEYLAGVTIKHLASEHHYGLSRLSKWLHVLGIIRHAGAQPRGLASLECADKGKSAGILAEYRKGTAIGVIRTMFHVGSAVVSRITDRAGLPRRERRTKANIQQNRVKPVFGPHKIPAAAKVARMRSSATWRAFFLAVLLEGRGPAYSVHLIHLYRRQTDSGRSEEKREAKAL